MLALYFWDVLILRAETEILQCGESGDAVTFLLLQR